MKSIPHKLVSFVFCLYLLGCRHPKVELNVQSNSKVTIIDSTAQSNYLHTYKPEERMAYYPIFYIGDPKDTFMLRMNPIPKHWGAQPKHYAKYRNWALSFNTKLSIFIDTSMHLAHRATYRHFSDDPEKGPILDSIRLYNSFPVFLSNHSDSLIQLGIFSELWRTVRQAKNQSSEWVDLEIPIEYFCGTGLDLFCLHRHPGL